jgi:hypothetical protein
MMNMEAFEDEKWTLTMCHYVGGGALVFMGA